jgi:hypothetical protein
MSNNPFDNFDLSARLEVSLVSISIGRTSKCNPLRRIEITKKKKKMFQNINLKSSIRLQTRQLKKENLKYYILGKKIQFIKKR